MARSKKDLDKDMMFRKIMPALADNPFSNVSQAPNPAKKKISEDEISILRAKLFSHSGEIEPVINVMEELVLNHLDSTIQKFNACHCDRCRQDIAAISLNLLPPKYVVADRAHIEEIKASIAKSEVLNALVKAVLQVRSHPRH